jgi:hypothetical protein
VIGVPGFIHAPESGFCTSSGYAADYIRHQFIPVGIENNTDRNFKNLEEMLGRAKEPRKNNSSF